MAINSLNNTGNICWPKPNRPNVGGRKVYKNVLDFIGDEIKVLLCALLKNMPPFRVAILEMATNN